MYALEKEMATHSSILVWRIPGTEEPGGLSMGSHRVGHNWSDLAATASNYPRTMWAGKESTCNGGDLCSIPELGRSPGEWKGYPLPYSGLENSIDCIVHGVTKSQTWLSNFHFISCGLFWTREVCGWWERSTNLYHWPHSVEDGSYKTWKELSVGFHSCNS